MKTKILAPALALAALSLGGLSLAACGPKTDAGNNTVTTDTLTLNEEGDAALGNSDAFDATGNDVALDNGTATPGDNALPPAEGNAL